MELIAEIRQAGFTITLDGEKVRVEYTGKEEPPEEVKTLLDILRERKEEAIVFLRGTMPKPYLEQDGGLVIPFSSETKYHWWKQGQKTIETAKEELRGYAKTQ